MPNMKHCMFENTYKDLLDCYEHLEDCGSVADVIENANQYDRKYIKKLIKLCVDIANEFGEEVKE